MGFSENQMEVETKRWVLAGVALRSPLKPICTNPVGKRTSRRENDDEGENGEGEREECFPTTPKSEKARIPRNLTCPPAPKKPKSSSRCQFSGVKEFFNVPLDLESVFIRRVET